ncbi:9857_t:CDS:1, partial [Dentiscutata erythropus]
MDNSAFRFNPKTWDAEEETNIVNDWNKSIISIEKLLDTIKSMPSIQTSIFYEMQIKKNNIKKEIEELSQNIDTIQKIQDKLDEYEEVMMMVIDPLDLAHGKV